MSEKQTHALEAVGISTGAPSIGSPTMRVFGAPPDDHPLFKAVGRLTAAAAQYEQRLDLVIWELVGAESSLVACVTAQINGAPGKTSAIEALAVRRNLSAGWRKAWRSNAGQAQDWLNVRHRANHDAWLVDKETLEAAQFKKMARGELLYGVHDADLKAVENAINGLGKASNRVFELLNEARKELQKS